MNLPNEPNLSIAEIRLFPVRKSGNLSTSVVYRTLSWPVQAAQQVHQGGFARARFPHQSEHFPPIDFQVETGEDHQLGFPGRINFGELTGANVAFRH